MSIPQSILIGLFVMAVVFSVLIILWGIVRLFSIIIKTVESSSAAKSTK